jgi:hypothetical protein
MFLTPYRVDRLVEVPGRMESTEHDDRLLHTGDDRLSTPVKQPRKARRHTGLELAGVQMAPRQVVPNRDLGAPSGLGIGRRHAKSAFRKKNRHLAFAIEDNIGDGQGLEMPSDCP